MTAIAMANKKKGTQRQTMVYKIPHRKLEEHKPHIKLGVKSFLKINVTPPLIERGLYCNHLVCPSVSPSVCPSVHTFVTDISASTGRNDCTSTSC